VGETIPLLEKMIQDTRTLIFSVSSPLLYEVGLNAALERLVEQFCDEHEASFSFVERSAVPKLDADLSVLLFDSAKELLVNAVKHSRATAVRVSLSARSDQVQVRVADNGVGIPAGEAGQERPAGFGLFSVKERLEYIGGTMEICSRRDRGTLVTLAVPVRGTGGDGGGK
jgi:signal transduction histidine kinase